MRKLIYALIVLMLQCGIALTAFAPDVLTKCFVAVMVIVVFLSIIFGILPLMKFSSGFEYAVRNIERVLEAHNGTAWNMLSDIEVFFNQRILDSVFHEYQEKLRKQQDNQQVLSDIDEYVNEDTIGLHTWQSIMLQVPGTMTSLGILGTFIGLLIGVRGIGFSSISDALRSVETLLGGIQTSFYTSIAGIILSVIFNLVYRVVWNNMSRALGIFSEQFHKHVIPPTDEQIRFRDFEGLHRITELLEQLPSGAGFNYANALPSGVTGSESVLMPQILSAMENGEFLFYLLPRFDLNNRILVGAEALVRWKHGRLGMVSPSVFIPILENNGYITKLDQYIWESVCKVLKSWIDDNLRPIPISVNVTKTDILAIDVAEFFDRMIDKYNIPPRSLHIEIAENAYLQAAHITAQTEERLKKSGFKVVLDGFDGDFFALENMANANPDEFKLDLRNIKNASNGFAGIFEQARKMHIDISTEGIESMEQLTQLRKCGCIEGQGFYLSKPQPVDDFMLIMNGDHNG